MRARGHLIEQQLARRGDKTFHRQHPDQIKPISQLCNRLPAFCQQRRITLCRRNRAGQNPVLMAVLAGRKMTELARRIPGHQKADFS